MMQVTQAREPLTFLIFWELMGLFSFLLVAFEYHKKSVFSAAWSYLLACEAGGLLIVFMNCWQTGIASSLSVVVLVLGLVAFGLKAGFPGLHTWLPEAHPAAPAPVSAVMSGAMIPLGFLGILRMPLVQAHPEVSGWVLLACGIVAAPAGMLLGCAQDNLKRLLAYSSVENMGVVSMGLGLGILGANSGNHFIAVSGFGGAFLHVINHAMLKGALFLGAGSILRGTGTLSLDALGGLHRRMPATGKYFGVASLALCGLPPGNAFIGEFLIYLAAFNGVLTMPNGPLKIVAGMVALSLALTGGFGAVSYAKAIGAAFLGEPRTKHAENAREVSYGMRFAMLVLLAGSFAVLCIAPLLVVPFAKCLSIDDPAAIAVIQGALWKVTIFSLGVIVAVIFLKWLCRCLPRGKEESTGPTWDCGYARPTAKMAYTGTALAQPVLDWATRLLHLKRHGNAAQGLFPKDASVHLHAEDQANRFVWQPVLQLTRKLADKIHHLQNGSLHLYLLVIIIALLAMLVAAFCL